MSVPDYQSIMLPLLKLAKNTANEVSAVGAVEILSKKFQLSEDDLKEMLPSGIQSTFVNRVGWASTYLKKAGLLESTRRGFYKITPRGIELLNLQEPCRPKKQTKVSSLPLQDLPTMLEIMYPRLVVKSS